MGTLQKVYSLAKKSMKGMENLPGRKGSAGWRKERGAGGQEVWVEGLPLPLVTLPRSRWPQTSGSLKPKDLQK